MIARPRVLRPDEVPDQELIVHRGDELDDVRAVMRWLLRDPGAGPFLLSGPPGTGKTMVAKHCLQREFNDRSTAYVNCWENHRAQHLLSEIVTELGVDVAHRNSTPITDLQDMLSCKVDTPRVVVLDELELVHERVALVALSEAPELAVIGIVNDKDEIADLLADAWDPLADRQLRRFPSYRQAAVTEILSKRADHALRSQPLTDQQLRQLARWADGDARLGIMILREAAQAATERIGATANVTDDELEEGYAMAQTTLHEQNVDRLSEHQHTIFKVLDEIAPASPSAIQDQYRRRVDEPRSPKTVRKYLDKMEWYGLVTSTGVTRDRRYCIDESGYTTVNTVE